MSVEIKLSARAVPGQVWKVKQNPITRKYGVRVSGGSKLDTHAHPGELGTIEERVWSGVTDGEAWTNHGLRINFSRGRYTSVDCADLSDFILVKKAVEVA